MLIINQFGNNNYEYKRDYNPVKLHCNPTFGYRLPKHAVYDIKEISHLNCGCCGNPMFSSEELKSLLNSFAANSKRALEHSLLMKYKDSDSYKFLKELSQIQPKKTLRQLISIPENQAKISTLPHSTKISINHLTILSDGITVKAPRVMEKLNKYYKYFSKEDQEILDVMDIYSMKYPKNTFSEIFQKPEVKDYHSGLYTMFKSQYQTQRTDCYKRLGALADLIPQKDVSAFKAVNTKVIKDLNSGYKHYIKKALVEENYNKFYEQHPQSRKIKLKIRSIINSFPYKTFSVDSFITNCAESQKSDMDIVKRFTEELLATFEHVHAHSKDGTDDISNGIILCKKCNNERRDIPYRIFLKFHPEMKKTCKNKLTKSLHLLKTESCLIMTLTRLI